MTKKFNRLDYEEDDQHYRNDYYESLLERRKMKRMRNAIRSKNIRDLQDLDDDYITNW